MQYSNGKRFKSSAGAVSAYNCCLGLFSSPQVLETCVNHCGERFHNEIAKFRFLNELIKVLSPKVGVTLTQGTAGGKHCLFCAEYEHLELISPAAEQNSFCASQHKGGSSPRSTIACQSCSPSGSG